MCHVRGFNLSYQSLTSYSAREKLRNLKQDNPEFWNELTCQNQDQMKDGDDIETLGDEGELGSPDGVVLDDTDVSCSSVIADMLSGIIRAGNEKPFGALTSNGEAETMEFMVDTAAEVKDNVDDNTDTADLGRGRRKKKANSLYSHSFWRHHDEDLES